MEAAKQVAADSIGYKYIPTRPSTKNHKYGNGYVPSSSCCTSFYNGDGSGDGNGAGVGDGRGTNGRWDGDGFSNPVLTWMMSYTTRKRYACKP
jgi:hypothetical protein